MSTIEKDNENLSDGAAEEVKTKKEIRAEKRAKLKKEKEEKKKTTAKTTTKKTSGRKKQSALEKAVNSTANTIGREMHTKQLAQDLKAANIGIK